MVSLQIREGSSRSKVTLTRFPANIGRSQAADVVLQSPGVWEQHGRLVLEKDGGKFRLIPEPHAIVFQNGEKVSEAILSNGDKLQIGAAEVQFLIAAARQTSLTRKEAFFWFLLGLVTSGEILLFALF